MIRFGHVFDKLKIKLISFHLWSYIPQTASLADLNLLFDEIITDKDFIQGLKFLKIELSLIKLRFSHNLQQNTLLNIDI